MTAPANRVTLAKLGHHLLESYPRTIPRSPGPRRRGWAKQAGIFNPFRRHSLIHRKLRGEFQRGFTEIEIAQACGLRRRQEWRVQAHSDRDPWCMPTPTHPSSAALVQDVNGATCQTLPLR